MNGTENAESGKLVKTLYMHLNEFLIIKDGLLVHGDENPGTFVTRIEDGHIYDVLIETFDFKTKTIRNKKYTVSGKLVCNRSTHVDMYIRDFTEYADVDVWNGDYPILRILADGTDPNIYRTIQIVDVTGEDHSTCGVSASEDKNENQTDENIKLFGATDDQQGCMSDDDKQKVTDSSFQESLLNDASSPKSSESSSNDTETTEDTCDTNDTDESAEDHNNDGLKQDIENLLHDVDALEVKLINITDRSALIKHYVETHTNSIGDHILKNEVRLLNTYLSSIGKLYGNKLARISQNIKDTLKL